MARKQDNQSENLLSQRMRKTEHGKKNAGIYGRREEINIVVQETDNNNCNPQFDINTPFSRTQNPFPQPHQNTFPQGNAQPNVPQTPQFDPNQPIPLSNPNEPVVDTSFEFPNQQTQETRNNGFGNKFKNAKENNTQQNQEPLTQEFTFNADLPEENGELVFDERYSNMYRNTKRQKRKPEKPINTIGDNAIDGSYGNPFEKKKLPKKTKLIILLSIIAFVLIVPQLVFRISPYISFGNDQKLEVDSSTSDTIKQYITVQNGVEDWDKDGIPNSTDKSPFNPDTDRNGIPDGETNVKFITKGDIVTYENITVTAKNSKLGFSKFLNYYVFQNYSGWVKISDEKGIPYIHKSNGWKKADYEKNGSDYLIKVSGDCLIEFVPEDTKTVYCTDFLGDKAFGMTESRYVKSRGIFAPVSSFLMKLLIPVTEPTDGSIASTWYSDTYHIVKQNNLSKAESNNPNKEEYDLSTLKNYEFAYEELYDMYKRIDNKETVLISIITKDGKEATCFAYAYDYLGNIYVSDARTSKTVGMINISPKAQVYYQNDTKFIREWYEFDGLGFSTKNGDILVIY